ncbi:MAG TPA: LCP family protein [Chloroflexota bacterium]|nr:LCP family protein [Chloroflexota bacterium]
MQNNTLWTQDTATLPAGAMLAHTEPTVVMRPVKPRRRWRRILMRVLIGIGILLLLLAFSGAFFWFYPSALGTVSMPLLPPQAGAVPWNGSDPINILAMGVDQRTPNESTRSDVMMVISITPGSGQMRMVSIPRDLAVTVPGYGQLSKINAGFAMGSPSISGGAAYAAFTVEQSLGIPINYWAVLNFNSFTHLIDALGGVNIKVDQNIDDPTYPADVGYGYSPFVISAGWHHLNGATALRYVRERHAYPNQEDQARIRHQQQLLDAVKGQALSVSTLIHLPTVFGALRSTIQTNLPNNLIPVVGLFLLKDRNVQHIYLDGTSGYAQECVGYDNGADLCPLPSLGTEVASLFHNQQLLDEHASVWMQNGTNDSYETSQVVALLQACHFTVAGSGPADNNHHAHTAVIVNSAQPPAPYTTRLLQQMFNARLITRSMPDVPAQIVLLIGQDAPQIPVP